MRKLGPPKAVAGTNRADSVGSTTIWMAIIYPFRAWRYNTSAVRLADVVTQPYDKISPALQQAYYQRSPYNLVRLILGLPELFDAERGENVYSRAARDFATWRKQGILIRDNLPCIYAYAQRFTVPGTGIVEERMGFIALGKLHEYSERVVFRHELTLSKPKSDRLNLLRATHAHFGQIFMLYSDPARSVENLLAEGSAAPEAEITDDYGVRHRLWRIGNPAAIRLLLTSMADKKLIIADGHHRYETALNYAKEHIYEATPPAEHITGQLPQPALPQSAAMMTFVNMDSDGLLVLPTHRVLHSLRNFNVEAFRRSAEEWFEVLDLAKDSPEAWLAMLRAQQGTAFVALTAKAALLLRARKDAVESALSHLPPHQRRLDLVQLHKLIFEKALGLDAEAVRQQTNIRYLREAPEAIHQVRSGEADVAFLTNPVTMEQIKEVAFAGDVMPQKSTDFYPKLLSGLTIYALD